MTLRDTLPVAGSTSNLGGNVGHLSSHFSTCANSSWTGTCATRRLLRATSRIQLLLFPYGRWPACRSLDRWRVLPRSGSAPMPAFLCAGHSPRVLHFKHHLLGAHCNTCHTSYMYVHVLAFGCLARFRLLFISETASVNTRFLWNCVSKYALFLGTLLVHVKSFFPTFRLQIPAIRQDSADRYVLGNTKKEKKNIFSADSSAFSKSGSELNSVWYRITRAVATHAFYVLNVVLCLPWHLMNI